MILIKYSLNKNWRRFVEFNHNIIKVFDLLNCPIYIENIHIIKLMGRGKYVNKLILSSMSTFSG